jgi:nucleoside-diphosphate-sugar epimerase
VSRILVTGASGFIGRRVVDRLVEAGHEVHAVCREAGGGAGLVSWHAADLLASPEVVADVQPETLVHLAWCTEHGKFWTAPENVCWVEASLALLRKFVAVGGRRAVMAGSCAEYDWTGTDGVLRERETPLRPATLYGAAKNGLQEIADAYARQEGLELAWGRVFFLYGPDEGRDRLFASVMRALLRGEPARTTDGTQIRDFLHVDDVGAAFAALAGSDVTGPVNIASGEGVALRDVVELIGQACGRPDLVQLGALPQRPGDPHMLVADVDRLSREVGFSPRVSLADGVAEMARELRLSTTLDP